MDSEEALHEFELHKSFCSYVPSRWLLRDLMEAYRLCMQQHGFSQPHLEFIYQRLSPLFHLEAQWRPWRGSCGLEWATAMRFSVQDGGEILLYLPWVDFKGEMTPRLADYAALYVKNVEDSLGTARLLLTEFTGAIYECMAQTLEAMRKSQHNFHVPQPHPLSFVEKMSLKKEAKQHFTSFGSRSSAWIRKRDRA